MADRTFDAAYTDLQDMKDDIDEKISNETQIGGITKLDVGQVLRNIADTLSEMVFPAVPQEVDTDARELVQEVVRYGDYRDYTDTTLSDFSATNTHEPLTPYCANHANAADTCLSVIDNSTSHDFEWLSTRGWTTYGDKATNYVTLRKLTHSTFSVGSTTTTFTATSQSGIDVSVTGGSGSGADFTVTTDENGDVTAVAVVTYGSGYSVGNTLTLTAEVDSGVVEIDVATIWSNATIQCEFILLDGSGPATMFTEENGANLGLIEEANSDPIADAGFGTPSVYVDDVLVSPSTAGALWNVLEDGEPHVVKFTDVNLQIAHAASDGAEFRVNGGLANSLLRDVRMDVTNDGNWNNWHLGYSPENWWNQISASGTTTPVGCDEEKEDTITLAAWIRPDGIVAVNANATWELGYTLIELRNLRPASEHVHVPFSFGIQGAKLGLGVTSNYTSAEQRVVSDTSLQLSTWQHVAVVITGTSYAFYINGRDAGSGTLEHGDRNVGSTVPSSLRIGAGSTNANLPINHYWGKWQDLQLFDKALEANAVRAIMNDTYMGKRRGWWYATKHDTTVYDISGERNHATVVGSVTTTSGDPPPIDYRPNWRGYTEAGTSLQDWTVPREEAGDYVRGYATFDGTSDAWIDTGIKLSASSSIVAYMEARTRNSGVTQYSFSAHEASDNRFIFYFSSGGNCGANLNGNGEVGQSFRQNEWEEFLFRWDGDVSEARSRLGRITDDSDSWGVQANGVTMTTYNVILGSYYDKSTTPLTGDIRRARLVADDVVLFDYDLSEPPAGDAVSGTGVSYTATKSRERAADGSALTYTGRCANVASVTDTYGYPDVTIDLGQHWTHHVGYATGTSYAYSTVMDGQAFGTLSIQLYLTEYAAKGLVTDGYILSVSNVGLVSIDDTNGTPLVATEPLQLNQWYTITAVITTTSMTIYVDDDIGTAAGNYDTATAARSSYGPTSASLTVGAPTNGRIRNCMVTPLRSWSATECQRLVRSKPCWMQWQVPMSLTYKDWAYIPFATDVANHAITQEQPAGSTETLTLQDLEYPNTNEGYIR